MKFFAILGAQRSGTSYLNRMLEQHPEICMASPSRPEPKYFLQEPFSACTKEEYLTRWFGQCREGQVLGEKSTSYIESPQAGERIRSFFPDAKAVIMLRHPFQRALSNYRFSSQHGTETRQVADALFKRKPDPILTQPISVDPFNYLGRSDYAAYIPDFIQTFGDDLKILIFEEVLHDQQTQLNDLFAFLGVQPFAQHLKGLDNPINHSTETPLIFSDSDLIQLRNHFEEIIHRIEHVLGRKLDIWRNGDPFQ